MAVAPPGDLDMESGDCVSIESQDETMAPPSDEEDEDVAPSVTGIANPAMALTRCATRRRRRVRSVKSLCCETTQAKLSLRSSPKENGV